ncbi:MAG: class I SAM-dependent methyltransferase [Candidatus Daviesbacteria bacterium]|nr:class I SAM-dependent methyltransferase [Candidatus Daviesbacteria bacterium]
MTFLYDWFSNNIPVWEKALKRFRNKENLLFLEIGCFEGKATLWLVENILTHPTSKIVVVDTFQGGEDQIYFGVQTNNLLSKFKTNLKSYISKNPKTSKVIIKKGFSGKVLRSLNDHFDFIYIDGSHIAKDVLEDIVLSWGLLKDDGVMVFDDYGWDRYKDETLNPRPAINCFLRIYKGWYKILNSGYQLTVQKKDKKSSMDKFTKTTYENLVLTDTFFKEQINKQVDSIKFMKVIKDSKFYKLWRIYCNLKDTLKINKYK